MTDAQLPDLFVVESKAHHSNGHSKVDDSLLPEQFREQSINSLINLDEMERLIDQIKQAIRQTRRESVTQSIDQSELLSQYNQALQISTAKLAVIRSNNQYLALLSISTMFLIVIILMIFDQKLPHVWFVDWINESNKYRINELGIDESMLPEQEFEWKFW